MRVVVLLLAGVASIATASSIAALPDENPAIVAESPAPAPSAVPYTDVLAKIATERGELATRWRAAKGPKTRAAVLADARSAARRAIVEEVFPPWYGTPWDFNGTSQTPGEGNIACGYFVSTVLRDAGFKVERVRLAQQASEDIVKTLAKPDAIRRYSNKTPDEVIEAIRAGEDGLFAVGFDYHVGFVVKEGETVTFCHSSFIKSAVTPSEARGGGVACEDPATTGAWYSTYYVVGRLLDDPMLIDWLEGTAIPTRKGKPG